MTTIEKILAHHSTYDIVKPGEIINVQIDIRVSRDLGGGQLIRQLTDQQLSLSDAERTYFTFDYYQTVTDPAILENQHACRAYARKNNIKVFDIHSGIGSHLMIDQGIAIPGCIMTSTDSHANILGAIGALGICLQEKNFIQAFTKGAIWYRVPKSVKINLTGNLPEKITSKDVALNLLSIIGFNKLLGYAIDLSGPAIDLFSLDNRITLASMANEFGAVSFFMPPNQEVLDYCMYKSNQNLTVFIPDADAEYEDYFNIDVSKFIPMVGVPTTNEIIPVDKTLNKGIDSAFIGTCTNGRIEDLRQVAGILNGKKVAPGVILKIVPSTDEIWTLALQEGLIDIFKESGAIVANAGCGGCASNQYVSHGLGEVTISSGNKNFAGLSGKGEVFIASPTIVAASAIAGYITKPELIPDKKYSLLSFPNNIKGKDISSPLLINKQKIFEGKIWYIPYDNIDTDKIYNSRYTGITDISELGNYTFSHLEGYEYFASMVNPGDIIIVGENFGLGSMSHHAVACFKSLGVQAIIAKSFAVVYEHNAITAGLPVIMCTTIDQIEPQTNDIIQVDLESGIITNLKNNLKTTGEKFSGIEMKTSIKEYL